jgi:hypothetical protein
VTMGTAAQKFCANCRHWEREGRTAFGDCMRTPAPSFLAELGIGADPVTYGSCLREDCEGHEFRISEGGQPT